ncbi:MAG: efflux RND transporter periplasmic adaptor subunit, partial [Rickettsiales bacterium]|nr:efflux RND transporter periplasmic adaptor subunit [Rickettsiales bacterium]
DEVEALGTLKAQERVEVTAAVTALVSEVYFEDGQRVEKGDILLRMDTAEEMAELEEEEFTYLEARRKLERFEHLVKKGAVTESDFDEQDRIVKKAKGRILAIQSRISQRVIKAPFSGIVGLRNISVGALVEPGTVITTLDDDSQMKLDFSVPAVFLQTLYPGVEIKAYAKAFPQELFKGIVSSVDSRIDPVTRSITARAIMSNDSLKLKPGLLMNVVLRKSPRKSLMIPEEAIITNGGKQYVYVVDPSAEMKTVSKQMITIGTRRKGEVEVVSGLQVGQMIVAHGKDKVHTGSKVNIIAVLEDGVSIQDILSGNKTL